MSRSIVHFELDMIIFVTAKKGCSKTIDQDRICIIISDYLQYRNSQGSNRSGTVKFNDFSRNVKAMYQEIQGLLKVGKEGVRNQ
jgi:hypothetical protein